MRIPVFTFATIVTLMVAAASTPAAAATRTWDGGGGSANTNWMTAANWAGDVAPSPGDTLVFPAGATPLTTNNNFPAGTEFFALSFADAYTVTGNRILIGSAIDLTTANVAIVSADITLKGASASSIITVTAAANGIIGLGGVINDQGAPARLKKAGPGRVQINGTNSYSGLTTVEAGTLRVTNVAGLGGSVLNGTTVLAGASLELALAGGSMAEPLTIAGPGTGESQAGALTVVSNGTLTGQILVSVNPSIAVGAGVTLSMTASVSGASGFRKEGLGTLRFDGTPFNALNGQAAVVAGTLVLARDNVSLPSGLTVGDGTGTDVVRLEKSNQISGDVFVLPGGWLDLGDFSDGFELQMSGGRVSTTAVGLLTLESDLNVDPSPGAPPALIEGRLDLGQPRYFTIKGPLSFTSPSLIVTAAISGAGNQGITKYGPGAMRLAGANTYGGPTTIVDGVIMAAHPQAFGGPNGFTTVPFSGQPVIMESDVMGETLSATQNMPTNVSLMCPAGAGPAICTWGGSVQLDAGTVGFTAAPGKTLRLGGAITGNAGLLAQGGGAIEFAGNGAYLTGTSVAAHTTLRILASQRIPDVQAVTLDAGSTLDLNGFNEAIGGLKSPSTSSKVLLGGGTLTVATGVQSKFSGVIGGTGALIKQGANLLELSNVNTYTGGTTVLDGALRLADGGRIGGVTVNGAEALLDGTGTTGAVTVTSGTIRPGIHGGTLTTGSLTMSVGATFDTSVYHVDTDGWGQVDVHGAVALGGATLTVGLSDNVAIAEVNQLVIIDNDGSDPVSGTFDGLAEGAEVPGSNKHLRITYKGGDGNDVALVPALREYYLSEGATGDFFDLDILIANPNADPAPVTVKFLLPGGGTIVRQRTIAAMSRQTLRVDEIEGLEATAVSTVVTSDLGLPIVVERTMRWDKSGYGAHTEKAATQATYGWYFAEGAQGFFRTYLLLANPQDTANVATVTFLRENAEPIERTYTIAPLSRFTVDAGAEPELASYSFGMHVEFDAPGVAERAMYFGVSPLWQGGHESAGVTSRSKTWFLAEGATGSFFETFILLANPSDEATNVTLTFLPAGGAPVTKTKTLAGKSRLTVNIEDEDPSLDNAAVATMVSSDLAILVERSQYWPDPAWYEAHNSFGVTEPRTKWGLAEGRIGGPESCQTFILIANPLATDASVTVTFLREAGEPLTKTFDVKAMTRFNVNIGPGTQVPELTNESFGALITSTQPIVVERAMYANANGQLWAAGTNATGTALP